MGDAFSKRCRADVNREGRKYHGKNRETGKSVPKQDTQRTSLSEGPTDTDEQTGPDRSTERNELDVAGLEPEYGPLDKRNSNTASAKSDIPSSHVTILFSGLDITVHIGRLTHPIPLLVRDRTVSFAIFIWRHDAFLCVGSFLHRGKISS